MRGRHNQGELIGVNVGGGGGVHVRSHVHALDAALFTNSELFWPLGSFITPTEWRLYVSLFLQH